MTFKCKATEGNPWVSRINTMDDGVITIDPEDAQGNFFGRHKKSSPIFNNIQGRCYEVSVGGTDHIRFIVVTLNEVFLYVGDINAAGDNIIGHRSPLWTFAAEPNKLPFDEDWVATKT